MPSKGRPARAATTLAVLAALSGAPGSAEAGSVTFTLDPPTILSYLRAVTPFEVEIGKKGLSQTLTILNPRGVIFGRDRLSLTVDIHGSPFPIDATLSATLRFQWNAARSSYEAVVESLPLPIPIFGSIDLADHVRPISIPALFSQVAGEGDERLWIDGRILSLRVLETQIQVTADLAFRRPAPPPAPVPAPPPAGSTSR